MAATFVEKNVTIRPVKGQEKLPEFVIDVNHGAVNKTIICMGNRGIRITNACARNIVAKAELAAHDRSVTSMIIHTGLRVQIDARGEA